MWHASVAYHASGFPLPVDNMRPKTIRQGVALATELLRGVGTQRMVFTTDPPGVAIHVQAPLTPDEIAMLPTGWMEIQAIDERGPCKLLDLRRDATA